MPIAAVGGSIIGGIMAGNAASNAAQTQANAANTAAQLQYQSGQQALGFQKQVYGQTQAEEAPYLQAGTAGWQTCNTCWGSRRKATSRVSACPRRAAASVRRCHLNKSSRMSRRAPQEWRRVQPTASGQQRSLTALTICAPPPSPRSMGCRETRST